MWHNKLYHYHIYGDPNRIHPPIANIIKTKTNVKTVELFFDFYRFPIKKAFLLSMAVKEWLAASKALVASLPA